MSHSQSPRPPLDRHRIVQRLRRILIVGAISGLLIVILAIPALVSGRPIPGPTLVILVLAAAAIIVSLYASSPSQVKRTQEYLESFHAMPREEQRRELFRRLRWPLFISLAAIAIEVPIAVSFWRFQEWQTWIITMLATTSLIVILVLWLIVRAKLDRF